MRYVGGDVYHRDWGWWDRAGDWNGPDFRATGDYLRKSRHGATHLRLPLHGRSAVEGRPRASRLGARRARSTCRKPEVVAFMKGQLDDFRRPLGRLRVAQRQHADRPAQRRRHAAAWARTPGCAQVIRDFLDKHPGCAFQAVNGGGNDAGYDYARYASTVSFSDGAVGILRNYYASLLLPPDKTSDIPDIWNPNDYDKATWRGLLCINFDMTGDTWDPAKLEGLRELIDIYHYLHKQGVVGRWVRVYRPIVAGDDPTMYFQRLSGDRQRGIIIPKRPAPGPVTIKPKGLLPDGNVHRLVPGIATRCEQRPGADLMERGIALEKMPPGELIYLNLPLHPGSKLDKEPPTAAERRAEARGREHGLSRASS